VHSRWAAPSILRVATLRHLRCGKRSILHFLILQMNINMIILPRQARDKHRENSQKGPSSRRARVSPRSADVLDHVDRSNLRYGNVFVAAFYAKTRILPRQARDKHRKYLKTKDVSAGNHSKKPPFSRSPFLQGVVERAAGLLRADPSLVEGMQVVRYAAGEHYHAHADYHTGTPGTEGYNRAPGFYKDPAVNRFASVRHLKMPFCAPFVYKTRSFCQDRLGSNT
jgi:hypothetical protein